MARKFDKRICESTDIIKQLTMLSEKYDNVTPFYVSHGMFGKVIIYFYYDN